MAAGRSGILAPGTHKTATSPGERRTVQRLIEQITDEGEVVVASRRLGRVHYHLSVYQHFSDLENEAVPASIEVEGQITPIDPIDLGPLHEEQAELRLRLADGRILEFSIAAEDGTIHSTARGLYRA